jgi:serine/threonine protein kinase
MPTNERLEDLFLLALDQDPGQRARFLAQQCDGDPALLAQIRALLDSDEQAASAGFWTSSALEAEAARTALQPDSRVGQAIGPYKILNAISSGGMGTVYLAVRDDAEYHMRVAIKIIKRGMDTELIVRRFRTERQILAQLEHPNIAHLLDGGSTADDSPYLVMEYVEGQPIDQYADDHRLSISERLRLFRTVCSAVTYAHQNLVIHRDLKPSNILVTSEGIPKLLDFGIAKLLSPDQTRSAHEHTAALPFMTPEYASPEQVRGEPMTTVSDVYSLGVLLYRLLTGHPPYRLKTRRPEEIAEAVCNQQPGKPSTAGGRDDSAGATGQGDSGKLRRRLRGDLDNIVLMAIRKEPERRYASVEFFSEDIRRHLDGLPVAAHRDTLGYRAGKFVRRNRMGVAAAILLWLSLVGGIIGTSWQAHVARAQHARAERRFNDVRKLANSFLFEFPDAIENIPGTLAARQLILKRALEYLDNLAQEAADDRPLKSELAVAYNRVGTLTWDVAASLDIHRKAVAIDESLVKAEPANRKYREQLFDSYNSVGDSLKDKNDSAGSLESHRRAMTVMESLLRTDPGSLEYRKNLADADERVGIILELMGQTDQALEYHFKASELLRAALKAEPKDIETRRASMNNLLFTARARADNGDYKAALQNCLAARETAEALSAQDPSNVTYQRDLWVNDLRVAGLLEKEGNPADALSEYRSAYAYIEKLSRADPGDKGHLRGLAVTYLAMGDVLEELKRTGQALESYSKAIATSQALLAADPNKGETRGDLANMYTHLGTLFLKSGDFAKAAQVLEKGQVLFEETAQRDPNDAGMQRDQAELYARLGDLNARLGHWPEARDSYQHSLNIWLTMRQRNLLRRADAAKPDEMARAAAQSAVHAN